jgi:MEMO1 family protein
MSAIPEVRPSPIAGLWYQNDPVELTFQIERYIAAADVPIIEDRVFGLIAPHAGHRYSGRTAGHAYRTVCDHSYELVVVVSPLHAYYPSPVLTSAHAYYRTPLGEVPIDREVVDRLIEKLRAESITVTTIANDDEHSLEIQLPFLQRALKGNFKLLPLMVRRKDLKFSRMLGSLLAEVLEGRSALLVASTDLSHFYNLQNANTLDREMLRQIESFSPEGVLEAEEKETGFACGAGAVATVLHAARASGATKVKVLHYSTSADETGDLTSVVGYGAAVILGPE